MTSSLCNTVVGITAKIKYKNTIADHSEKALNTASLPVYP